MDSAEHPQNTAGNTVPGMPQTPLRSGGQPGNPRVTAAVVDLIEDTRQRANVPLSAMLAALSVSPSALHAWRTGRSAIREGKAQAVIDRVNIVKATIDLGEIRGTPPGQRTDRFLSAVTFALAAAGQT